MKVWIEHVPPADEYTLYLEGLKVDQIHVSNEALGITNPDDLEVGTVVTLTVTELTDAQMTAISDAAARNVSGEQFEA